MVCSAHSPRRLDEEADRRAAGTSHSATCSSGSPALTRRGPVPVRAGLAVEAVARQQPDRRRRAASTRTATPRRRRPRAVARRARQAGRPARSGRLRGRCPTTVRYLSLEWIDELSRAVAASAAMASAASDHEIGAHPGRVRRPRGRRHLPPPGRRRPGPLRRRRGRAGARADGAVWDTAVAVATGELNAQEAFVNGHIRLYGDQQRLLDAQPVFGALDAVFTDVRERTEYA